MTICRVDSLDLSDNGWWSNEGRWSPLVQSVTPAIPGVPIVEQYEWQSGMPITVANLFLDRPTVVSLWAMRDEPLTYRSLVLPDARGFSVLFDFDRGDPVDAAPIKPRPDPSDLFYLVVLRFITAMP